ncbi:hypothetical protein OGAPHI_007361 [Ogataea philodendri]|uniref:N-terminal acetyltransferase B complex subunit MDM20 n=1 Tax=Ogataea philodendri TaxID=1378263 RepID=A0A9P8T022_9ASCO|nr:uncharacterized protein OGAPHI_007361 [Ogataea philodendri]KAH3660156.1 hypothetical protein OGAPHI_007361 [Ogataea philodendri]
MYKDSAIQSAVQFGNFRNALTLVAKKIQKYPNSSYFYALEAHILALSGKRQEAETKANDLLSKFPSDPDTLKLLSETFEICEAPQDVFDKVCKKYPTADLVYEYFSYSVTRGDVLGMQKSSMLLTRAISSSKQTVDPQLFKFWAAVCLMLVCRCTILAPSFLKLYPQLGLRLMEQVGLDDAQKVYVYVRLLQLSGRHDDSLAEMEKFLEKENDLELKIIYLDTLKDQGHSAKLYDVCKRYLIELKEDDWDTWKLLIQAAKATEQLDECRELVKTYSSRNTKLAAIELNESGSVEQYLESFGTKLCCFTDLKSVLSPELREQQYLQRKFDQLLNTTKPTSADVIFLVNYMKFKALDSRDDHFVAECCRLYSLTNFHLDILEDFDYFPGFEFLILAVETILEQSEFDLKLVYSLIVLLEDALSRNKYEFHLKLWLIRLYTIANLQSAADTLYKSLKIKFVQHDTLSHYISTRRAIAPGLLETVSQFYPQNVEREVPAMIIAGFQSKAMNKLQGFIEFQSRLTNSFAKFTTSLELLRAYRIKDDQKQVDKQVVILRSYQKQLVSDNRDFKTFWDCGVHERIDKIEDKLPGYYSTKHLQLMVLRELIIYDSLSKHHQSRVKELTDLYNELELSPIDKWSYSVLLEYLHGSPALELPPKPQSMLLSEFNYYFTVVVDTYKQMVFLQQNTNKLKSLLTTFRNENREFKSLARKQLEDTKKQVQSFFKTTGKPFKVTENSISQTFAQMRQDLDGSIAYLQGI